MCSKSAGSADLKSTSRLVSAIAGRRSICISMASRPSDGETRWISVKSTIERDANGRALRLIGAHADITEQVVAEQALRQSEELYRKLADQLAELNATLAQRVEEKKRER